MAQIHHPLWCSFFARRVHLWWRWGWWSPEKARGTSAAGQSAWLPGDWQRTLTITVASDDTAARFATVHDGRSCAAGAPRRSASTTAVPATGWRRRAASRFCTHLFGCLYVALRGVPLAPARDGMEQVAACSARQRGPRSLVLRSSVSRGPHSHVDFLRRRW